MNPSFITSSILSEHSWQLFSLKLLFRTTSRIVKMGRKSLWQEIVHAIDMVLSFKQKAGKILKNYLWETLFLLHLQPAGLAKLAYQPLAHAIVKSLIIQAFGNFYHHLYITYFLLCFQILQASSQPGITCSKLTILTLDQCEICSKLAIKTSVLLALLLTLNIFYSTVCIVNFEQVNYGYIFSR